MNSSLCKSPPTKGNGTEIHIGKHFAHSIWVRIQTDNFEDWFICFGFNRTRPDEIYLEQFEHLLLILHAGKSYLMDLQLRQLLFESSESVYAEAVFLNVFTKRVLQVEYGQIVLYDYAGVEVAEILLQPRCFPIKFTAQVDNLVYGELYWDDDHRFDFQIDCEAYEIRFKQRYRKQNWLIVTLYKREEAEDYCYKSIFH